MERPKEQRAGGVVVTTELVERCRSGDERAWRELVEATHRQVYTLCLRILRDPDDAAEASQDAYLKAWRGLKGFREESLFTTWLYRIAANAAISKQRSRKRTRDHETRSEEETWKQIPSTGSVEATAGARLELISVERALDALPPLYREAILLRDVYELSIEEVAGSLGISESAAKVRIHRGRKKLRAVMWPSEEGPKDEERP